MFFITLRSHFERQLFPRFFIFVLTFKLSMILNNCSFIFQAKDEEIVALKQQNELLVNEMKSLQNDVYTNPVR